MEVTSQKRKIHITLIHNKAFIFSLEDAKYLRSLGIVGVLGGTLPSAPQQNLYMGLPLILMVEEVIWLILKGHAVLVPGKDYVQSIYDKLTKKDMKIIDDLQDEYNQKQAEQRLKKFEELQKKLKKPLKTPPSMISDNMMVKIPLTPQFAANTPPNSSLHIPIISFLADHLESYSIYQYLRSQNFVMLPGMRFGGRFVAYPGDPLRYHSHLIVNEVPWEKDIGVLRLVGGGRLGTGVKKAWVIASIIEQEDKEESNELEDIEEIACFSVEWAGFG